MNVSSEEIGAVSKPTKWERPKFGKRIPKPKPPPYDSKWRIPVVYGTVEVLESSLLKGNSWKKKFFIFNHEGKLFLFKKVDFKDVARKSYSIGGKNFSENVREGKICIDMLIGRKKHLSLHFLEDEDAHQEFFDTLTHFTKMKELKVKSFLSMIVYNRLKKVVPLSKRNVYNDINWKGIAEGLSIESELKKTYLNPDVKKRELDKKFFKVDVAKEHDLLNKTPCKLEDDENSLICYRDFTFFETAYDFEMLKTCALEKFKLPLRVVITELSSHSGERSVRKLLDPLLEKIPSFRSDKEFGRFSLGIIIGPYYLEYTKHSLVIPKRLNGFLFSFYEENIDAFPYYTYVKKMKLEDVINKIAKVVLKWNTSRTWESNMEQNNAYFLGNSAMFVEEILNEFDIKIDETMECLKPLLNEIRKSGSSPLIFSPMKEFKDNFKMEKDSIVFKNHVDIDEFVSKCQGIDEIGFNMDYKREFSLLKSFDRVFWLRYLRNGGKNVQYSPYESTKKNSKGCYFKLRIKFVADKEYKNFPRNIPKLKQISFSKKKSTKKKKVSKKSVLKCFVEKESERALQNIVSFLSRKEFLKFFLINSLFYELLNKSDEFWTFASDGRRGFGPVKTQKRSLSPREFFLSHICAPKICVLYTSLFLKEEEFEKSFQRTFPLYNKDCITFVNIHMKKLPCFNFLLPFDIIFVFGGSHFLFEHDSKMVGNRMYDLLKRGKSVVTLMFCNWLTKDEINSKRILDGCWQSKRMFMVEGKDNVNEGVNDKNKLKFTKKFKRYKGFEKLKLGSSAIAAGVLNDKHGRLIASWTKGKKPYVALAESIKFKLLHCNMFLTKETVDVVMELAKYIHTREGDLTIKRVEKKEKIEKIIKNKNVEKVKESSVKRSISKDFEDEDDDEISDISSDSDVED